MLQVATAFFHSKGTMRGFTTHFISGHLDLTEAEFDQHYAPKIEEAVKQEGRFVVGDARGTDTMAQRMLLRLCPPDPQKMRVIVFHMLQQPRFNAGFATVRGFTSDEDRDISMSLHSRADIAWVRPGRQNSGTAKNLQRRALIGTDKGPKAQLEVLDDSRKVEKIVDAPLVRLSNNMAFLFKSEAAYCLGNDGCGRYFNCNPEAYYRLTVESYARCRELLGIESWLKKA